MDNPELSDPTSKIDRMSSVVEIGRASTAVAEAHELLDGLFAADLSLGTDDELLEVLREVERLSRRLAAVGYALIVEAQARCLPHSRGAASMAVLLRDLLRDLLRLHPAEARARVRAAEAAGPRRALSGEALDPVYPDVGAAQVAGEISAEHARVIVRAVEALPAAAQAVHGVAVERELLGYARTLDPQYLHRAALTIHDRLNPDGYLHDPRERDRKRDLTVQARPHGSASVRGELTPECTQRLLGLFDALAAPAPASDDDDDDGMAGWRDGEMARWRDQRLPVGGAAAPRRAARRADPAVPGRVPAASRRDRHHRHRHRGRGIVGEDSARTGRGLARTGHGALVPAREALRWGGGDQRIHTTRITADGPNTGMVTGHSDTRRTFSENQRLAILARDRGCTFPRVRPARGLDADPPHHRVGRRRPDHDRQRRDDLRLPPPHLREAGLALHHPARPTRVDPATTHRPGTTTTTQPTPRETTPTMKPSGRSPQVQEPTVPTRPEPGRLISVAVGAGRAGRFKPA